MDWIPTPHTDRVLTVPGDAVTATYTIYFEGVWNWSSEPTSVWTNSFQKTFNVDTLVSGDNLSLEITPISVE